MKRLVSLLIICFMVSGCLNDRGHHVMMSLGDLETDTISYPLLIDGGTKVVFPVGHMTPDKGLKLYYDTIPRPATEIILDDSVRQDLSTP